MSDAPRTKTPSILLVEDAAIIAMAEQRTLERAGYRVRPVYSGDAAVAAVREFPDIDIVLMDIELGPGIDGPEAARRILALRDLPIVFVTSHSEPEYVARVEAITQYGYVLKGAGDFTLIQAVKTALQLFAARRTLEKSEARFRSLFESVATVAVQGYAPDGTIHFWNRASETLYGYTAKEVLGRNLLDLTIPEGMRDEVARLIRGSGETGEPILSGELVLRRRDGSLVDVYSSHTVLRHADGTVELFCMDVDISDRKRYERELRRQEAEYRTLIEQQNDLFVRVNGAGAFEFVSDSYCRLFGKTRSELIGHSFMPLVHEDDREATRIAMEGLYAPPYRCRLEQRAWTVDGWRWLEWDDTAIVDDDGRVIAILGAGRDVTERKRAEEEQREILNSLPIPVVVSEGDEERVIMVNAAFRCLFGYTEREIPDVAHWFRLAYPDPDFRRKVARDWTERVRNAGRTGNTIGPVTVDAVAADGSVRTVIVRGHVLGRFKLNTFSDLTEINVVRKRLERSLIEKDHLMSELNHRVKNNLTLVSSLLRMKEAELGGAVDLADVRGQIDAIGLVHEKLYSTGETDRIDLHAYLGDLVPSILSIYPGGEVQFVNDVGDIQLPPVRAVLVGIIVNELATNAMKHGFDRSIPARFVVDAGIVGGGTEPPFVELAITNNGRPFAGPTSLTAPSTLGLRLVSTLADQLHGEISLVSASDTTFRVRFPSG
ncbi:MAG: PAS domain S-box protein [Alkalispirochaeta sp.]